MNACWFVFKGLNVLLLTAAVHAVVLPISVGCGVLHRALSAKEVTLM